VLPLAASAVSSYALLNHGVIASFADLTLRLQQQVTPAHRLRSLLLEALVPVDEFVDDGDPAQLRAYRQLRERIDGDLARLHAHLMHDPEARLLIEQARQDWSSADRVAAEIGSSKARSDSPPATGCIGSTCRYRRSSTASLRSSIA
jgi:hypothetical protein